VSDFVKGGTQKLLSGIEHRRNLGEKGSTSCEFPSNSSHSGLRLRVAHGKLVCKSRGLVGPGGNKERRTKKNRERQSEERHLLPLGQGERESERTGGKGGGE